MGKSKKSEDNKTFIWGLLMAVGIATIAIIVAFVVNELNVPKEYKDALASLQNYNQNGCSLLDQTVKQEYFAKSKLEECFTLNDYSSEAKEYAWEKANIDFKEKAIRLVQYFVESMGHVGEKYVGDADASYEAAKKAALMNKEGLKSEWIKNYGYTEKQIDNAFKKVLGQ